MSEETQATRMYIHRRIVVKFLLVVLALLSVASFAAIALGMGLSTSQGSEDSGKPTRLSNTDPFYVLLIGSDSLEGTALYTGNMNSRQQEEAPHADALLLVRVDPSSHAVTLVTVPANTVLDDSSEQVRDTLAPNDPTRTVRMVERIAGVNVRYWFLMDFSGFEAVVDQVGAVVADVPVSFTMQDPVTAKTVSVSAGTEVPLDGAAALAFIRAWNPYTTDVDPHRQLNVRHTAQNIISQVLSFDDESVRKVLGVFEGNVQTNMKNSELLSYVTHFYDNKNRVRVYACTGPYSTTEVSDGGEPIVRQQVQAWRELMTVVDSGEDPASVLPQYDFKGSASDFVKEEPQPASSGSTVSASSSQAAAAGPSASGGASKNASASAASASGSSKNG